MDNIITYDIMFRALEVKEIIIIEDEIVTSDSKEAICYGLARLSMRNRIDLFREMDLIEKEVKHQIEDFIVAFDELFEIIENWDEMVPFNDITCAFDIIRNDKKRLDKLDLAEEKYRAICIEEWKNKDEALKLLATYGVGVDIPNSYDSLFDEYIYKNPRWENYRIFTDFYAKTREKFEQCIKDYEEDGMVVCIVDDQLKDETPHAAEIVNCIEEKQDKVGKRQNVIGLIYSSFTNSDRISDKVYFEYVKKGASKNEIQVALTKSAYSNMLALLKSVYKDILTDSFDDAKKNKHIAYYLSCMAETEGITNYQVITSWINLLFEYKLSGNKELLKVAKMTQLIGLLEDSEFEYSDEMRELNTFEAFDFSVNKFREPISSGDIFKKNSSIYILVGQDCDMMNRANSARKSGISELVRAKKINCKSVDNAVSYDGRLMHISNFRMEPEGEVKTLEINYRTRELIENQILQLCQFNDDGKCCINLKEIDYNASGVEPQYYTTLYGDMVKYFKALRKLSENANEELKTILEDKQSSRLMRLTDFSKNGDDQDVIDFKLRRICRLKRPYMLYLYKMYLEYQGRHPFDCINLSRVKEMQIKIIQEESSYISVDLLLTPDRELNINSIEKLDWYVDTVLLGEAVSKLKNTAVYVEDEGPIKVDENGKEFKCIYEDGKSEKMIIKRVDQEISIEDMG